MKQLNRKIRWRPAVAIVVGVGVVEAAAYYVLGTAMGEKTWQALSLMGSAVLALVLLLVWWVLFSRIWWRIRLIMLGSAAAVGVVFALVFRMAGVSGEMFPKIAFRWSETAEERAAALLEETEEGSGGAISAFAVSSEPPVEGKRMEALWRPLWKLQEGDWPQFRGPDRDGVVRGTTIPEDWAPEKPLWKRPVGLGWSSFAIVGDCAFTQEQRGNFETVVCYAAQTGKPLWVHKNEAKFSEPLGGVGPRATPTFEDGLLYALGATGILDCLEARTGSLLWTRNILKDAKAQNLQWGMAGSPLIYGDWVIVSPGGSDQSSLVAYDKHSGKRVWGGGSSRASYSSPLVHRVQGEEQILIFNGEGFFAHRPVDGAVLWKYEYTNMPKINVAQPIPLSAANLPLSWPSLEEDGGAETARILLSTGYAKGSVLLDLTLSPKGEWTLKPAWHSRRLKPKFNNLVAKDGYTYGADEGILTCIDLENGRKKWKDGRYGYGQLLLVENLLLILAESGDLVLVEANPEEFREVSRIRALKGKSWSHPAIGNGLLLVRNGREACAFSLP